MTEENPFTKRDREQQAIYKLYGIDDLYDIDRAIVWYEAQKLISPLSGENITDEQEIRKIIQEVRQQYLEYKQQKLLGREE